MRLTNTRFNTHPVAVHCGGFLYPVHQFNWQPIKEALFASPRRDIGPVEDLTIITFNNGHQAMGVLEQSLDHLGLPYRVYGQGVENWNNAVDKPRLTLEAARECPTRYLMAVDSRDGLIVDDPAPALAAFRAMEGCRLLISADRFSYPPLPRFKRFEDALTGAADSEFRYLVAGAWLGEAAYVAEVFEEACAMDPLPEAPRSEQGILRDIFMRRHPAIRLDYRCQVFQNVGFLSERIIDIEE